MRMKPRVFAVGVLVLIFAASSFATGDQATAPRTGGPMKAPTTEPEMIKSAMSAAPPAIAQGATIVTMDEKMSMKTLRPGTNGWTCLPDMPTSPGADPMCLDKNGLEWAHAWMARKNPPADKMGFGYMLVGGSDASNTDPFATKPAAGGRWVDTGPHVMILNIGTKFDGYPTTAENTKVPYVMFAGTPYAHLMMPVR
jgi:hypothetical protein